MPKKIYKKWWVWVIAILILVFGFINASKTSTSTADKTDNKQEEQKTKDTESDKSKKEKEINIDEELLFLDHKLIVESVKVYEESNNILMDLNMDWLNQSFPDKTTFLVAMSMDVHQNDKILAETNNAWHDQSSDVYFPNAVGGSASVRLTYELVDNTSPVKIVFVPHDEYDKNQEITINID